MPSFPTASHSSTPQYFSNTLSYLASTFTCLRQSDETSRLLFMSSFQGPFPRMHTVKYSRFYRLTKTFGKQDIPYGLLGCIGSSHGMENETQFETPCKITACHSSTTEISSHIQCQRQCLLMGARRIPRPRHRF